MSSQEVSEPSDEEMRKLLLPNPSQEQALDALIKSYGESGQEVKIVKELESYDDKNFWVKIGDTSYLAKFHNGVESKDFLKLWKEDPSAHEKSVIHLQNTIMEHLSQHGISTSKPQMPKTSCDGNIPIPVSIHEVPVVSPDHGPCKLVLRLLSWVEGQTMDSVKMLPLESLADAGRFLGRLTKSLSKLDTKDLAAARRYHQWDTKNTADLKEFVQYIDSTKRRTMVESVIEAFQKDIIDSNAYKDFPISLIHADFNDANILLDKNCRVSGVIDFGDSVERWVSNINPLDFCLYLCVFVCVCVFFLFLPDSAHTELEYLAFAILKIARLTIVVGDFVFCHHARNFISMSNNNTRI